MTQALGFSPEHKRLVEEALSLVLPDGCVGLWEGEESDPDAIVVFTPSEHRNSFIHILARRRLWISEDFIRAVFSMGFNSLDNLRLSAMIEASNVKCLRLAKRMGFELEGVMKGFEFGDLLVLGLLRGNCKWVK